jgi:hypothetical protein
MWSSPRRKTIADPFAGRITMFRVVSGVMRADSTVLNKTKDAPERLGHLMLMQGKTPANMQEIKAGDLGAVAKLKDTLINDVLGDKNDAITYTPAQFPEPVLAYAIEPKSRGDEDKIRELPESRQARLELLRRPLDPARAVLADFGRREPPGLCVAVTGPRLCFRLDPPGCGLEQSRRSPPAVVRALHHERRFLVHGVLRESGNRRMSTRPGASRVPNQKPRVT